MNTLTPEQTVILLIGAVSLSVVAAVVMTFLAMGIRNATIRIIERIIEWRNEK